LKGFYNFTFLAAMDAKGTEFVKNYYVSTHFNELWSAAREVCIMEGMDLLTLETEDELKNFQDVYFEHAAYFKEMYYHIGGILETIADYTSWHWLPTKEAIKIQLKFAPGEPTKSAGQNCLAIQKVAGSTKFAFDDINCAEIYAYFFVCEHRH